jgi:hypothetical protein
MCADRVAPRLSPEDVERFERTLYDLLARRIDACPTAESSYWAPTLAVDYGPDGMLRDAVLAADLPAAPFPYKTLMGMDDEGISVSVGYRAPNEYLCQTKRRAVVAAIHAATNEAFPPNYDDMPEASQDAFWGWNKAVRDAAMALPEHPEGHPDDIVRGILAGAERTRATT